MKNYFPVMLSLLFVWVLAGSCMHQRARLTGRKWYQGQEFWIEFGSNRQFHSRFALTPDSVFEHQGKFIFRGDTSLALEYTDIPKSYALTYEIKDSILVLVYRIAMSNEKNTMVADSHYLHLNPVYPEYHIQQLYHYGTIRDTSRTPGFIYFEF